MRIIKQGSLPELQLYTHTCTNCRCQFEFQQKEATASYDQRDGGLLTIACPTCSRQCYITKRGVHTDHWGSNRYD